MPGIARQAKGTVGELHVGSRAGCFLHGVTKGGNESFARDEGVARYGQLVPIAT